MSRSTKSQKGQNILENNSRWCKKSMGWIEAKIFKPEVISKWKENSKLVIEKLQFFDTKAVQSKSRAILISEENPQTTKILGSSQKLKSHCVCVGGGGGERGHRSQCSIGAVNGWSLLIFGANEHWLLSLWGDSITFTLRTITDVVKVHRFPGKYRQKCYNFVTL